MAKEDGDLSLAEKVLGFEDFCLVARRLEDHSIVW